jgi:hypothetical protein
MFSDLEQFVVAHRPCGELTSGVGELTDAGYVVRVAGAWGAIFERWVTSEIADRDLLYSLLLVFPS